MIKKIFCGIFLFIGILACDKKDNLSDVDPGWNTPGSNSDELVVMSYNIRHCAPYYGTSETTKADVDNVAAVLKRLKPDVVFLQEVDKNTTRSLGIDQTKKLAELAGYPFHYFFKAMDYQGGDYGIAIISGIPLQDCVAHRLPKEYESGVVEGDYVVGTARIRFANTDIVLVNAHLSVYQSDRDKQMPYVLSEIIGSQTNRVLFCGDFNAIPSNLNIQQLTAAKFLRTNTDAKNFTIPSHAPNREIDYISYRPGNGFSVYNHLVHTGISASDHLPITAKLKIIQP
ncbi:MAG: endonuclease/exonuclease/phosphatase family protein [Bacteroidales bacterium]